MTQMPMTQMPMAQATMTPVILSGGAGTRLWPMSRQRYPKQFLPLAAARTMLQETVARVAGDPRFAPPLIVCNEDHRFLVAEQLRADGTAHQAILLEPMARNTAPAVALAALWLTRAHDDAIMVVLPSDHVIHDVAAFNAALDRAATAAAAGHLVTFGITPRGPETGFGYIHGGAPLADADGVLAVTAFVEKPDEETAQAYLVSGDYYWNSGMFVFRTSVFLAELERLAPEILAAARAALTAGRADADFFRADAAAFGTAPAVSIDYAVMEHTEHAAVVPADMGWSDVGSWSALWEIGDADRHGNVILGDVVEAGTRASYLHSDGPLIAAIGLTNMVVVATPDAVLVAPREHTQQVKAIVDRLAAADRHALLRERPE